MRVVCNDVSEFLSELETHTATGGEVYQECIRMSVLKNKSSEVVDDVVLQLSAVLIYQKGGEYILEAGVFCGKDYKDASQDLEGTRTAESFKECLADSCAGMSLKIRPGQIFV